MRLHHLIEFMAKNKPPISDAVSEVIPDISKAVGFDFGDIALIPYKERINLAEFAEEIILSGVVVTPYPLCSYSFKVGDVHVVCLLSLSDSGGAFIVYSGYPEGPEALNVGCFRFARDAPAGKLLVGLAEATSFANGREMGASELSDRIAASTLSHCFMLSALLMAKGVHIELEGAPEKLNAKRIKKGKPPISDIRVVTIRIGGKHYHVSGHEKDTHASPRLHWRRGHLRRLPSGEIIAVSPCLVGAANHGDLPKPKEYIVKKAV